MSDELDKVKRMARLAGVELTDARAENLVRALPDLEEVIRTLNEIDFGEAEPSSRFWAPGPDEE